MFMSSMDKVQGNGSASSWWWCSVVVGDVGLIDKGCWAWRIMLGIDKVTSGLDQKIGIRTIPLRYRIV